MKVSLNWLREYVDINLAPDDLAQKLTMAGIEAEVLPAIGDSWAGITVGRITTIQSHPNADRLKLVTVDLGTETETVVCGAPNLKLGDKVAFATVGAQLRDGHSGQLFQLKSAKIRGVISRGMICSERELGISDSHEGIMVLEPEAPVGVSLDEWLGDVIIDLDVTPNRPDCLSVVGIARELGALTGETVHLPETSYAELDYPIKQKASVEIIADELCPRYSASLIVGVRVSQSPEWLRQRLLKYGMRPINNVVDVTNYVMVEYGQPLHAFDYEQISGQKIIVRKATAGETLTTLDGVDQILSDEMLVIADEAGAVAVAGVMGGVGCEVVEETTSVLLEAANFNPASIHHTGSALKLYSEARMRFERGIRPELATVALKRATQLIIEIAGGGAASGILDVYPGREDHKTIRLSLASLKRFLGTEFGLEQVIGTLTALGFDCKVKANASEVWATVPYWRSDIIREIDIIEEVARIIGYDEIPTKLFSEPIPHQAPEPLVSLKRGLRNCLVGYGFQEIITYSLTNLDMLGKLRRDSNSLAPLPLRVINPMTVEQEYLRNTLRAGLLASLASNRKHEDGGIRLFELGKVYLAQPNDLPLEPEMLCGILSGARTQHSWHGGNDLLDFYDAKGVVEALLACMGLEANFVASQEEAFHRVRQAAIVVAGSRLGIVGEVYPRVLEAFEIAGTVSLFEIDLGQLLPFTLGHRLFQPAPRFPAVERDVALLVDETVTHNCVKEIIKGSPLVEQVDLFDIYYGKQVPPGKKSLAYRIKFQSAASTLTDGEVDKVQEQILNKLCQELGATLRS